MNRWALLYGAALAAVLNSAVCREYSLDKCGEKNYPRQFHIAGGQYAKPNTWPWAVSIRLKHGFQKHICGGTLISRKVVLTAAHCLYTRGKGLRNWRELRVGVGEYRLNEEDATEQYINVAGIYVHPARRAVDGESYDNDVALLELAEEPRNAAHVRPACLPHAGVRLRRGRRCVVVGFGQHEFGDVSNRLKHALAPVHDDSKCARQWGSYDLTDTFCAGRVSRTKNGRAVTPIGPCQGDSGGPLVCPDESSDEKPFYVYGVISWGSSICLMRPAIFAEVAKYSDWIHREFRTRGWKLPTPVGSDLPTDPPIVPPQNPKEDYDCNFAEYFTIGGLSIEGSTLWVEKVDSAMECVRLCCATADCKAIQIDNRAPNDCMILSDRHCDVPGDRRDFTATYFTYVGKSCANSRRIYSYSRKERSQLRAARNMRVRLDQLK